jgi:hypothetical protein
MEIPDLDYVSQKLSKFKSEYQIDVLPDWGNGTDGSWQPGKWLKDELDKLHGFVDLLAGAMGGSANFIKNLGGVEIKKANIGKHGGEAYSHRVSLSEKAPFSAWTVIHELAHAWDANHRWQLSVALEKYTGGYTNLPLSYFKRLVSQRDSGFWKPEEQPGRRGRFPGCNAAGYFYGDKPSGSNWAFNRKEDFAESVAMYIGWNRDNELSAQAHGRVERYCLPNGTKDKFFGMVDNWTDYARFFYPDGGDYAKTKRWQFIDGLVRGKITLT